MSMSRVLGIALIVVAATACGKLEGPTVTVGTPVQGNLAAGDRTDVFDDGSFTDIYQIELTAGQQVTIDMESGAFDTYMAVLRSRNNSLAQNDDGIPGTTNSRIAFTAPSAGTFYIATTSLAATQTGAYTLTVR